MMKSDPVITYNHMEDDDASRLKSAGHPKKQTSVKLIYIAEAVLILSLIMLMFFIF